MYAVTALTLVAYSKYMEYYRERPSPEMDEDTFKLYVERERQAGRKIE